ncbi:MAG: hypothetical protein ACJARI_001332 [Bacteroidia bacterium]|jgi:hypothetical protein
MRGFSERNDCSVLRSVILLFDWLLLIFDAIYFDTIYVDTIYVDTIYVDTLKVLNEDIVWIDSIADLVYPLQGFKNSPSDI